MMECMFGGGGAMFWGMAAAGILLVAVLLLAVAALAKYVFAGAGQEPSWPIPILEFGRRIAVDLTRPGVVCTYNLNNSVEQSSVTTPAGFMACAYVRRAPASPAGSANLCCQWKRMEGHCAATFEDTPRELGCDNG